MTLVTVIPRYSPWLALAVLFMAHVYESRTIDRGGSEPPPPPLPGTDGNLMHIHH